MKSMSDAITTMRSIMLHGFLMYGGNPFCLRVALLNRNPWAMILMQASIVNKTVKQLSRYPTNKMYSDLGLLSGVLMTKVTELIKIRVKILLSNNLAHRLTFFSGVFLITFLVLIIELAARLCYLTLFALSFFIGFKLSN